MSQSSSSIRINTKIVTLGLMLELNGFFQTNLNVIFAKNTNLSSFSIRMKDCFQKLTKHSKRWRSPTAI